MNDTTSFEAEEDLMDGAPEISRRQRLAMVVGVGGILGALTLALLTAHAGPRVAAAACPPAPTARAEVRR